MEEEGIVNLREVGGAAGQEASTVRGREGAKKLFESYLLKRKLPKFDILIELEDQICNQSILKQFGSFLIDDAETVKKGGVAVLFKGGSALQYLSHIATIISLRWPENENYKDMFQYLQKKKSGGTLGPGSVWISNIRTDIQKEIQRRCIDKGEQFAESSVPIGRNLLYKSCNVLLKENTTAAYIKRSVFVTNFSATGTYKFIYYLTFLFGIKTLVNIIFFIVGRGGEVSKMSANSASWCDIYDVLTDDWNQQKTGRQDLMNFFNDFEHWEIDFYHCLAGYLMCGAGAGMYSATASTLGGNFIYPHLAYLKGSGAAQQVTKAIRELSVLGETFESTSLRCGAALTMVTHPTTSMFYSCVRAGHNLKDELRNTFHVGLLLLLYILLCVLYITYIIYIMYNMGSKVYISYILYISFTIHNVYYIRCV